MTTKGTLAIVIRDDQSVIDLSANIPVDDVDATKAAALQAFPQLNAQTGGQTDQSQPTSSGASSSDATGTTQTTSPSTQTPAPGANQGSGQAAPAPGTQTAGNGAAAAPTISPTGEPQGAPGSGGTQSLDQRVSSLESRVSALEQRGSAAPAGTAPVTVTTSP